jgi:ABC transporter substrate binding protein
MALRDVLEKLGWNDGRNVRIDVRWGGGNAERLRTYAVELVGSKPDVMVAGATSALERLKQATKTIPIVLAGGTVAPALAAAVHAPSWLHCSPGVASFCQLSRCGSLRNSLRSLGCTNRSSGRSRSWQLFQARRL